ncbi:MAG: nucleotide excision repair endonuclease [Verrucomicrobiota bacterium]|jgi:predicted GIY-YIG superfamily endonuclease
MSQLLLLPDPRPLDQRLGREFFLKAPRRPGVYLMRDAADKILYIGKAKNLKQRLNHYRNANPDRLPRRHLRMVREVARIEFQFCTSETAALRHEQKLIRTHKPKFNRAGVWEGQPKFVVWRVEEDRLHLGVVEVPGPGWWRFGPLGATAIFLHLTLSRLLWLAVNPDKCITELPAGWIRHGGMKVITVGDKTLANEISSHLESCFWSSPDWFISWLHAKYAHRSTSFERKVILTDFENLKSTLAKPQANTSQFLLI